MASKRLVRPFSALSSSSTWICPSCTRASIKQHHPRQQRRKMHSVPLLPYHKTFSIEGIPGLMSKDGYKIAWTDYQSLIVSKLNELTAGEPTHNDTPKNIIINYARDPMNASLFNHASMAYNNHSFFSGLSTYPTDLDHADVAVLRQSLERTFGSIDTLRTTMLDTAAAMFGPGFVWLVWLNSDNPFTTSFIESGTSSLQPNWRILTTYNAGTPYPEAGWRQQGIDMNTSNASTFEAYKVANHVGAFGVHSAQGQAEAKIPVGGARLMPVLCVNTWEHVWIYDYGILGKRKFLADWWDAIDWVVVKNLAPDEAKRRESGYLSR